ncbi:uncharacterized protein LOC114749443 [Neltuma alba]|uniref:uncharacterized protein LOC114749443 n=1 Tax=Neltuma alba TaxID=207710 RepID=UPI0010A51D29|nr:uncharacterized protein LOC114749443 [Prosopis alba]
MADIAYRKTLEFDGPLGSAWRSIVNLAEPANPIIHAVQCQWLTILSFLDDQFVVVQKIIEALFPPSSHLFVKNDDLVLVIMSLPEKFDDALNKIPEIIHQFPALECTLLYLISWLNCLVSTSIRCGLDYSERTDNDESNHEGIRFFSVLESSPEPSEAASKRDAMEASTQKRGSYKEALMKDEDEGVNGGVQKIGSYKEALMKDEDEGRMKKEDQILGLFESGWTL